MTEWCETDDVPVPYVLTERAGAALAGGEVGRDPGAGWVPDEAYRADDEIDQMQAEAGKLAQELEEGRVRAEEEHQVGEHINWLNEEIARAAGARVEDALTGLPALSEGLTPEGAQARREELDYLAGQGRFQERVRDAGGRPGMSDVERNDRRTLRSLREHAADKGHCPEFREQCAEAAAALEAQYPWEWSVADPDESGPVPLELLTGEDPDEPEGEPGKSAAAGAVANAHEAVAVSAAEGGGEPVAGAPVGAERSAGSGHDDWWGV